MFALVKPLILASGSLRRQKLLRDLGFTFEVRQSTVPERHEHELSPEANVMRLSGEKVLSVAEELEKDALILGADTIVVLENEVMNKPEDVAEAKRMLSRLSDHTHAVYTGFTIYDVESKKLQSDYEVTEVTFRKLSEEEIEDYVLTGAPMDKAGAYGIQGDMSATFAERINGCFYNVVGLPLAKVYTALRAFQEELGVE